MTEIEGGMQQVFLKRQHIILQLDTIGRLLSAGVDRSEFGLLREGDMKGSAYVFTHEGHATGS